MIINFTFKNWKSFRDEVQFSMIAGKERQHSHHIARVPKYGLRLLPVSAIFGGNASGKSNFVQALKFLRDMVIKPPQQFEEPIALTPFLLDQSREEGVYLNLEFLLDEKLYHFELVLNAERVLSEKLTLINSTQEHQLYHRKENALSLNENVYRSKEDRDRLMSIAEITPRNRLFLSESVFREQTHFLSIFKWFRDNVVILSPQEVFLGHDFLLKSPSWLEYMSALLKNLDTGVEAVSIEKTNLVQPELLMASGPLHQLYAKMSVGEVVPLRDADGDLFLLKKKESGELEVLNVVTKHKALTGELVNFGVRMESDGTQRLFDLLPLFIALLSTNSVCVIDEIDRSLHAVLVRKLLDEFLLHRQEKSRSQLIFTTHDLELMTQDLFRRDEMWTTERDPDGISSLYSFGDFVDIRSDLDIRRGYLDGRLGGIPNLGFLPTIDKPLGDVLNA